LITPLVSLAVVPVGKSINFHEQGAGSWVKHEEIAALRARRLNGVA
jgi:hypothetical protein